MKVRKGLGWSLVVVGSIWPVLVALAAFIPGKMADLASYIPVSGPIRQSIIMWFFKGGHTTWGTLILVCLVGLILVIFGVVIKGRLCRSWQF